MWQNKHATGNTPPADLIRSSPGASCIYEVQDLQRFRVFFQSYATRQGGKIHQTTIYGYTAQGVPMYLLKVEVLETGTRKSNSYKPTGKPRGRPKQAAKQGQKA